MPRGERRRVPRGHEAPGGAVPDHLPEADVVGAHDRGAAGHGLQEHHAERGQHARRGEHGGLAVEPRPLLVEQPEPLDPVLNAQRRAWRWYIGPQRAVADHLEHEVAPSSPRMRAASSIVSRPLRGSKRPDEEDAGRPGRARLAGREGPVEVGVDPVGDDLEVLLGEVGPQRGDAGLGDRDQPVGARQRAAHVGEEVAVAPVAALEVGVEGAHVHGRREVRSDQRGSVGTASPWAWTTSMPRSARVTRAFRPGMPTLTRATEPLL